jgi:hypothetical protein
MCYQFGAGDIPALARFVATTEQDNYYSVAPGEIQAISKAIVNFQFLDGPANSTHIAQIAEASRVEAGKNPRFGPSVAQIEQPFSKDVSLLELEHLRNVSDRIRLVKSA